MQLPNCIILFIILGVITETFCNDYVFYPNVGMKYKFYNNPIKWYDAKLKCEDEESMLAMPKNDAEALELKKIFNENSINNITGSTEPSYAWLGFHDAFEESNYITLNGDSMQKYYHKWMTSNPDNSYDEDCITIHRSGLLKDMSCNDLLVYVCQKNGIEEKKREPCLNDNSNKEYTYYPNAGMYYKYYAEKLIWNEARVKCQSENAKLAMPCNENEATILTNITKQYQENPIGILINYHDIFKEGEYLMDNGNTIQYAYSEWHNNEPSNFNGNNVENCGALMKNGKLNDVYCESPWAFVCERNVLKKTHSSKYSVIDPAYIYAPQFSKYYKIHSERQKWSTARAICHAEGGYLAILTKQEEIDYLYNLMRKPKHVTKGKHLIGYHDMFKHGEPNTVFGDPMPFANWAAGQPESNLKANEHCGTLQENGRMHYANCDNEFPFICEITTYQHNIGNDKEVYIN